MVNKINILKKQIYKYSNMSVPVLGKYNY